MIKKFINYGSQYIDQDDIKLVTHNLKSNLITQGTTVTNFEKKLKVFFGAKYATTVSNGTAALFLALKSFNLPKNSSVVTSPITFIASASTILMNNLKPILVDVNSKSPNLDPNILESKLKKNRNIKAVIAVDYGGYPCDWKALNFLKKKFNFKLINDNCHALGSKYFGSQRYGVKYADAITQSFHAVKNITTGEGGAIITNIKKINDFAKIFRSHGIIKNTNNANGLWHYSVNEVGYNFRITDFQCALGISQLKKINKFIKERRKIAKFYDDFFVNYKNYISVMPNNNNYYNSYHIYPIRVNFKKLKISKKKFFDQMLRFKIKLQVHYIPLYKQPFLKMKKTNFKKKYPNSEKYYEETVSLPMFYGLKFKKQKFVLKKLIQVLKIH